MDQQIDPTAFTITDGVPHMTYQQPGTDVNFMWDGEFHHPIQVCPGGYAEPPRDQIPLDTLPEPALVAFTHGSPSSVLLAFMSVCDLYLEQHA